MTEPDVIVTKPMVGICHMQVCARRGTPYETIEVQANLQNPSGLDHGWRVLGDEAPEKDRPVTCAQDSERVHYLLVC